jgi:hypothetical protein
MDKGDTHQQVGYLRSYPRLSQTFIVNEILALEKLGLSLHLFALENPQEDLVQAQVAEVRARVYYLDSVERQGWVSNLRQHLQVLAASPLRYIRTLVFVLKGRGLDAGYRNASRLECFRMAVLLVWLMRRERRGGRDLAANGAANPISGYGCTHLHAHFAHDPALVALLASRPTGSLSAHSPETSTSRCAGPIGGPGVGPLYCCVANQDYLPGSAGTASGEGPPDLPWS